MRRRVENAGSKKFLPAVIALVILPAIFITPGSGGMPAVPPAAEQPRDDLQPQARAGEDGDGGLVIVPSIESPIEPSKTSVFCSTFQLAWNEMVERIVGERIVLDNHFVMVDLLNRMLSTGDDLDGDDYLAMAGYGADDIGDRIGSELVRLFGEDAPAVDRSYNDDDAIVAYACLIKSIKFTEPFDRYQGPIRFNGVETAAEVQGFGTGPSAAGQLRSQVEIIDYRNGEDFIIRLATADPAEDLIMACVRPCRTLLETWEKVDWRIAASSPEPMGEDDILIVPQIEIREDHSYRSLLGRYLLNDGFKEFFVAQAQQDISFGFDRSGASLASQGKFMLKKGGYTGKSLIFSRPFLMYLKKKDGRFPYFALWVGNDAALVESR